MFITQYLLPLFIVAGAFFWAGKLHERIHWEQREKLKALPAVDSIPPKKINIKT
jgi:hypothetical protein